MKTPSSLTRILLASHAIVLCLCVTATVGSTSSLYDGYTLVWSDEFDKDGPPDPCNWTYERGFVRNSELQWYQAENAQCSNGMLVIEARRERKHNPRHRPGNRDWRQSRKYAEYTSACLTTKGLHSWRYGRFEMRARIDTRSGLWPAFWTLGSARGWPGCGEIDIMEYYRGMLLANAAWATGRRWVAKWDGHRKPIGEFNDPDWSDKFHIWRMDWDAENIKLYVDGELLNTIELDKTINGDSEGKNPFHEPHYILLNQAIGGTNGGDPSQTQFPSLFEVDYIRVYEKAHRPPHNLPVGDKYELAWSDEFEGGELDMGKWGYRGLGPRRDAVNVREAVSLNGRGQLILTTERSNGQYHTAMIGTQDKYETAFGYFECRVRLQSQLGHWSAFWLQSPSLGNPVGDPKKAGTEIDIFEYLRKDGARVHHNLHWDGYGKDHKHAGKTVDVPGLDKGWHTFGLLWTDKEYVFYVDGRPTWRSDQGISHRRQYIILSLEVGKWAGDIEQAKLPDQLLVDYVRVYKKRARE